MPSIEIEEDSLLKKEAKLVAKSYAQKRSKEAWMQRELKQYESALKVINEMEEESLPRLPIVSSNFGSSSVASSDNTFAPEDEEPPIGDPLKLLQWVQKQLDDIEIHE